jgi:hypothetical protein
MKSKYSISLGVNCVQEESTVVHFQVVHCSQYSGIIDHVNGPGYLLSSIQESRQG